MGIVRRTERCAGSVLYNARDFAVSSQQYQEQLQADRDANVHARSRCARRLARSRLKRRE